MGSQVSENPHAAMGDVARNRNTIMVFIEINIYHKLHFDNLKKALPKQGIHW